MVRHYCTEELRGDHAIVTEAVKQRGVALQDTLEELRGDRMIVNEAVKQYGGALKTPQRSCKETT